MNLRKVQLIAWAVAIAGITIAVILFSGVHYTPPAPNTGQYSEF